MLEIFAILDGVTRAQSVHRAAGKPEGGGLDWSKVVGKSPETRDGRIR
jgi:hypothetical protein